MITFHISVPNFKLMRADLKQFLTMPETSVLRHLDNQRALLDALLLVDAMFDAVVPYGTSVTVAITLRQLQCDALWLALPPRQPYSYILDTLCKAGGGQLLRRPEASSGGIPSHIEAV